MSVRPAGLKCESNDLLTPFQDAWGRPFPDHALLLRVARVLWRQSRRARFADVPSKLSDI